MSAQHGTVSLQANQDGLSRSLLFLTLTGRDNGNAGVKVVGIAYRRHTEETEPGHGAWSGS